ncbi:MAG: dockerin type I repeat-containing protein, partial [Clostridia bacterium]|nr:dockerin type I repeat-containing protein [Clostridia bacterium]
ELSGVHWMLEPKHVKKGDYLAFSLHPADEEPEQKTVRIYVDGGNECADLLDEWKTAVTLTPTYELKSVAVDKESGFFEADSEISLDLTLDAASKPAYALAAALAAAGTLTDAERKAAIAEGVRHYRETGRMNDLREAMEACTVSEILNGFLSDKTFEELVSSAGLTGSVGENEKQIFNSYKALLKTVKAFDPHAGRLLEEDKTLASLATETRGTYADRSEGNAEDLWYYRDSAWSVRFGMTWKTVTVTLRLFPDEPDASIVVTDAAGNEVYAGMALTEAFAAAGNGSAVRVLEPVVLERNIRISTAVTLTGSGFIDFNGKQFVLSGSNAVLTADGNIGSHVKSASNQSTVAETRSGDNYVYRLQTVRVPAISSVKKGSSEFLLGMNADLNAKQILLDVLDPSSVGNQMRAGCGITVSEYVAAVKAQASNGTVARTVVSFKGKTLTGSDLIPTGATVTYTLNPTDTGAARTDVTFTLIILGDVNGNGSVDSGDSMQMMGYYFGNVKLSDVQLIAADVNRNGGIDAADALKNTVKYSRPTEYKSSLS